MRLVAALVEIVVPDNMTRDQVKADLRSSIEFGAPNIRILYVLPIGEGGDAATNNESRIMNQTEGST